MINQKQCPFTPTLAYISTVALLLLSGCGSNSSGYLQNPLGLGPAPVTGVGTGVPANDPNQAGTAAGNYSILGKTTITNTDVSGNRTSINGDIGLSPADATGFTGMSTYAAGTGYATADQVINSHKLYAAAFAAPTPSRLGTAILSMEHAYDEARTRSNPDFLNLASGHLGGLTLAPGLYHFGSDVTIAPADSTDTTLAGSPTDIWIFQVTGNLSIAAAQHLVLSGGAKAANVYWQVAGNVVLNTTSHFVGNILCKTDVHMRTGAVLNGSIFAQTEVTLDTNTIDLL